MASAGGDLALIGARLRTNTAEHAGDTGLLIRDGRIVEIGDDAAIRDLAAGLGIPVRDVAGATVTPGLFDSHTHPHWAAQVTAGVDLGGLGTIEEIRAALAAEHARLPEGAWLRCWNLEYEPFEHDGMRPPRGRSARAPDRAHLLRPAHRPRDGSGARRGRDRGRARLRRRERDRGRRRRGADG